MKLVVLESYEGLSVGVCPPGMMSSVFHDEYDQEDVYVYVDVLRRGPNSRGKCYYFHYTALLK